MQRQLRSKGGMTVGSIRQKYGLGSFVRKLIPNEVANFAAKAAPFVAPFNPVVGGLMRGIGRYDKRGNLGDAVKQGALTYGFGKGANYLGTRDFGKSGTSIADRLVNRGFDINKPVQTTKNILLGQEAQAPVTGEMTEATTGVFGKGGNFNIFKGLGGGRAAIFTTTAVASLIKDALTKVPPIEEGETLEEFNIRRKATVGGYLKQYLGNTRKFQNVSDKELDVLVEQYNTGYATGGRVGFANGSFPMEGYGIGTYNIDKSLVQVGTNSSGQAEYKTPSEAAAMGIFPVRKEDEGLLSLTGDGLLNQAAIARSQQAKANEDALNMLNESMAPTTQTPTPDATMEDIYAEQTSPELISLIKAKQAGGMNQEEITQDFLQEFNKTPDFKEQLGLQTFGPKLEDQISNLAAFQYNQPTGITMANTRAQNITANDAQRAANQKILQAARANLPGMNKGGRVGFAMGNPQPVNPFTPKPTGPVLPNEDKPYTPPPSPGKMASMPDVNAELYQMFLDAKENGSIPKNTDFDTYKDLMAKMMSERKEPARQMANMGGMMDIPIRQNKGGITELDMRATGGFVPVGIKEKADDVPAMLSKNEFVMTADAVRAAGGGSIQKGAQKMYNTMKKLESRVS